MTQTVVVERSNGKKLKKNQNDCSSAMMGKQQKLSKDYSSGLVQAHKHAVETVGETEGFGSSCHADSEDSCTPKRKRMSLNLDQSNSFNAQIQVFPTSKMSSSEKKELEMRLRAELEKVQTLQKKILSRIQVISSGVALSSSTDGHAKKKGLKRSISGRFEPVKQAPALPSSNLVVMVTKQCETLLKNLMHHKYGWVFNRPVDVIKLKIPDYLTIIKHPMDLGTVKNKLESGSYSSLWGFASDVRLTFTNAITYNPPGNDVHIMADALNKMFEKKWKPIGEKLALAEEVVKRDNEATKKEPLSQPKKNLPLPRDCAITGPKVVKPKISFDEKQELSNRLQSLIEYLPDHIVDFLRQNTQSANATEDEIEIDIESLSDDTLIELRKLLNDSFGTKQSVPVSKIEPSEMEMLIESGVSNSSPQPSRDKEPDDEEVDIGGDDPPITSYPPVEIEKDIAPIGSTCSSSSSSGTDSGSSSSDSDTGSSSGSGSDLKAAATAKSVKEHEQPGIGMSREDKMHTVDANETVSGMDREEHSARTESVPIEADGCQEGENATSKRQVSPDKLYRAALLRGRFADTILKAREKTVNQSDKKDAEKLRWEREELERQKREDKARLQAEARAAEDTRRKAEAKAAARAAAEAKRKRQIEREAARQALIQMEKTVDINENSLCMKDLEILTTAPAEELSTVHETSPDGFQNLGLFNLGGSNPLEQLGLFMKDDEEEEEEGGQTNPVVNDVEEGEID